MKAKEATNSHDMCHSYVLLAFLRCTSCTVQDRSARLSQYRGCDMGRKAEDWGSIVSEGVIFLFTQTDSVEYQSSALGTASFFSARKNDRSVKPPSHLPLAPGLRMLRATSRLPRRLHGVVLN